MTPWKLPAELDQALPRQTRLDRNTKLIVCLFVFLFGGVAVVLVVATFQASFAKQQLKQYGAITDGIVTSIHSTPARRSREGMRYTISYSFRVSARPDRTEIHSRNSDVSAAVFGPARVGTSMQVTYDRRSPAVSELTAELEADWAHPYDRFRFSALIVLPVFFSPIVLMLIYTRWNYVRDRRLVRWGLAAAAVIVAENEVGSGTSRRTRVTYQFRDRDGHLVIGSRDGLPSRKKLEMANFRAFRDRILDNPTVLYDPANSARNVLYPSFCVAVREAG